MSTATKTKATAADLALIVLRKTYGRFGFGYFEKSDVHSDIVDVLSFSRGTAGNPSLSAETVYKLLCIEYRWKVLAAHATCHLFHALGRADELGSLAGKTTARQYEKFLRTLSTADRAIMGDHFA